VTREIRKVSFDSLEDYWAAMEAESGLSGATYLALSPDDQHAVREHVQRTLLPSDSDGNGGLVGQWSAIGDERGRGR
jgi:hypothetical protein